MTEVAKSKWVEIFRGKGKGTAAVVWGATARSEIVLALSQLDFQTFWINHDQSAEVSFAC